MALWLVKATWAGDDAERTEQWEVVAAAADEALREAVMLLPTKPHHVEVKRLSDEVDPPLQPGRVRRLS